MILAANSRHPAKKRVVCPTAIRRKLIWDAHQQAHAGAQGVLTKLQLRWYWPNMGRYVRRRVRQCKSYQTSQHGRLSGEAGQQKLYAERPWQAEAVDPPETCLCPSPEDLAGQERPPSSLEVRPLPPTPRLRLPLPESESDPEVQTPPPRERGFIQRS